MTEQDIKAWAQELYDEIREGYGFSAERTADIVRETIDNIAENVLEDQLVMIEKGYGDAIQTEDPLDKETNAENRIMADTVSLMIQVMADNFVKLRQLL